MQTLSLKLKMTVTVFSIVAVLMSSGAFLANRYIERELKQTISAQQFTLVSSLAGEVDDKLATNSALLLETAKRIPSDAWGDPEMAQRFLDACPETLSVFDDGLFLFSPTGMLIAQTPYQPNMRGRDYSFREYYRQTVATGRLCISTPYRSTKRHQSPAIMFTVPLFGADGKLAGIMGGSLNLSKNNFLGKIAKTRIGKSGFLVIFNADRKRIVHPDSSLILEAVPIGKNLGLEKAIRGFEGSMENVNSRGERGITSFKRLSNTNWIIAAHYHENEAYAAVYSVRKYIGGMLAGAILLSIFIVRLTMVYLTEPLLRFTKHVARLRDLSGEEKLFRGAPRDEIGTLAEVFNCLIARLEREAAELRRSKELYQVVADFSTDMAVWRYPDGTMAYVSPHSLQITGYADTEFYADPWLIDRIIHPEDRNIWIEHQKSVGTEIQALPVEFRIVTKSSEVRWISHFCRLAHSETGEFLGERGSFSDFTAKKMALDALLAHKDFEKNLISNATAPIFVLDDRHRILFWNKACEEMTGFTAEEMVGTSRQWEPFYPGRRPSLADVIIDHGEATLAEHYVKFSSSHLAGETIQAEGWYLGLGGKDRYILFDAAPIRNADGELVAAIETFHDITDRKIAEDNVMLMKNFYLTLFDEFPALVWRSATDAQCNYFNKTWLQFTGRPVEDELEDGWAEGVHPDDRERCLSTYLSAFRSRKSFSREYRLRRHDGEYRWVVDTARPFLEPDGAFAGYIGACYDITERRRAVDSLRRLSFAVEQSPTSIIITDLAGRIEYVNSKFSELTGYSAEAAVGQTPAILKSGAHSPAFYREIWQTITDGNEWRGEMMNRKQNGELYWENAIITPLTDGQEIVTHFLANKEDITARKRAEEELSKKQQELLQKHEQLSVLFTVVKMAKKEWEQTLDCIGDLVILTDEEGRIRRCNRTVVEFAGLSYNEVLGREWHTINLPEMEKIRFSEEEGGELFHRPTGRWFFCTIYPFNQGEVGKDGGNVITLHDCTELKKIGESLEKAYHELKAAQAQMLQREKMASIGQLAAGVAHEINNPIGFIMSNLGTLGKYLERIRRFTATQADIIGELEGAEVVLRLEQAKKTLKIEYVMGDIDSLISESLDGAERVKKIVQNLKAFSRVNEADVTVVDLRDCLDSTINIAWNELKYKATLKKEYGDISPLRCNPQQLNQVFLNLIVNAGQAFEGQGEIGVRTWQEEENAFIAISDTGCGIPEDIRNRIFDPFFTTKEVGKGTGLGLSISYDIVKKHGGEITVESTPGAGSTFTVRIPI